MDQTTATPTAEATDKSAAVTGRMGRWKGQIEESRKIRQELADGVWKENVNYRRGKPFSDTADTDRVSVPTDWSMTKAKEAGLFSQVPTVILDPALPKYKGVVPIVQRELNDVLQKQVKVEVAMEEALADLINASGIAGIKVGYLATFKDVKVPDQSLDDLPPEAREPVMTALQTQPAVELPVAPDPTTGVPGMPRVIKGLPAKKRVDCRFYATRLSPSQLLWPADFKGSDFDDAAWVGWDGSLTWAQALREFGETPERPNGLKEEHKEKVCGQADSKAHTLNEDAESRRSDENLMVSFTEIFYNAAKQDDKELHLEKIRRLVFVTGLDEPIIDEDLEWQQWNEETESFIGLTKYPLRIATLTYISDQAVPPSDSEIGRPQVDEKMRSRSQMITQRDRSQPMRWANVNRIDPMILANIMRGDYQQIIPVNGRGDDAIGEVSRAQYPKENWDFDRVGDKDLAEAWQVGPNQNGSFDSTGRTAAEANIVQGNFATRQAKERGKVQKLFLGIAECTAGLMQLYYDGPKEAALIGPEAQQQLDAQWDRKAVSGAKFVFRLPKEDSTVKLDSNQRLEQLSKFVNLTGKSGFVNIMPVMEEMATLSGLDPAVVIVKPNPKAPEPPNVSLRADPEGLMNPVVGPYLIALMQKGHPVTPEDVVAAQQLLIKSSTLPDQQPPMPVPGGPDPGAPTSAQPPGDWSAMERVSKRADEGELGG